jgi:hypothetical protein
MNDQSAVGNNVKQSRINQEVQKILSGTGLNPREKELVNRIFQNPTASTAFWQLMQQSQYDIGSIMPNLRKVMVDKRKELELTKLGANNQPATTNQMGTQQQAPQMNPPTPQPTGM